MRQMPAQATRLTRRAGFAFTAQRRSNILDRNVGLDQDRETALLAGQLFPRIGEPPFIVAPGCGSPLGFLAVYLF
jgi:hypothetical protein